MNRKENYKPKSLIIGVLLFGISMLFLGMIIVTDFNGQDILYATAFIGSIIGFIIGEGFLLNASSYDVNEVKDDE